MVKNPTWGNTRSLPWSSPLRHPSLIHDRLRRLPAADPRKRPRKRPPADFVIDLGLEGGDESGEILVEGTPEEVARHPMGRTGRALAPPLFD